MITFWQQQNDRLVKLEKDNLDAGKKTWVDARQVSRDDIRVLEEEFGVQQEHILDILDPDELSRVEKEDDYTLFIVRIPLYAPQEAVSYFTCALGIILFEERIITICWTDCEMLRDFASLRFKSPLLNDFPAFVIRILSRADITFLRYLKEINRLSTSIQEELQRAVQNNELIKMLNLEKSLVFFTTSLKSNQLLLEKLTRTRFLNFDADDRDWLEDVEIDNRQAIEMADTYSDIMSGMMDAFASVISNNLNIVMKKLTIISLVLMMPTFIVSFFGMNVPLPLMNSGWFGITLISVLCLGSIFAANFFLNREERKLNRLDRGVRRQKLDGRSQKKLEEEA
ncbi:MAG: magnesium transporter CorA family protein [Spirochaetaceae bacterium]|jgi:magnesium transporter|nr:magnesium transporter CorA family protein [Spirochaetaceae bacterium]